MEHTEQELRAELLLTLDIISQMKEELWQSVKDKYSLPQLEKLLRPNGK